MGKRILKFESPIEERFITALAPELRDDVDLECQQVFTGKKNRRADAVLTAGDRRIVVECDGREFHDYGDDLERDMEFITAFGIDGVIRFKGCDIYFDTPGCIREMKMVLREMFSDVPPCDEDDLSLASLTWNCRDVQPIYRFKNVAGVGQIKSDYWTPKLIGKRMWKMGEFLEFMANHAGTKSGRQIYQSPLVQTLVTASAPH